MIFPGEPFDSADFEVSPSDGRLRADLAIMPHETVNMQKLPNAFNFGCTGLETAIPEAREVIPALVPSQAR